MRVPIWRPRRQSSTSSHLDKQGRAVPQKIPDATESVVGASHMGYSAVRASRQSKCLIPYEAVWEPQTSYLIIEWLVTNFNSPALRFNPLLHFCLPSSPSSLTAALNSGWCFRRRLPMEDSVSKIILAFLCACVLS